MALILVADDNRQIASVLAEYLKQENRTPVVASDGEQALGLFRSRAFDAVLLNVMMPKLDGFSVCREIRKTSCVPVIMIIARHGIGIDAQSAPGEGTLFAFTLKN